MLMVGTQKGLTQIVVPGSAFATIDTYTHHNPYITKNQRRELLVKNLLEKLPPETIQLSPDLIGKYNPDSALPSDEFTISESDSDSEKSEIDKDSL